MLLKTTAANSPPILAICFWCLSVSGLLVTKFDNQSVLTSVVIGLNTKNYVLEILRICFGMICALNRN